MLLEPIVYIITTNLLSCCLKFSLEEDHLGESWGRHATKWLDMPYLMYSNFVGSILKFSLSEGLSQRRREEDVMLVNHTWDTSSEMSDEGIPPERTLKTQIM